jgi:hypothetical protein
MADWYFNKRQRRYLRSYMNLIDTVYNTLKQNKQDCRMRLNMLSIEIMELLKQGKINDSYYGILNDKVSEYVEKIDAS